MSDRYFLDSDHNVVGPIDVDDPRFRESQKADARRVDLTHLPGDVRVSTVFLGLDHRFTDAGLPVVFETLVFGGPFDEEMERYCTWDEAVAGHARWVEKCQPIMTEDVFE